MYLLAIDIGTSSTKVALFDFDGRLVAQTSKGYKTFYPNEGWAEQNPEDWWRATCEGIKELKKDSLILSSQIVGIGIAGQSWSAVAISKNGEVLGNTPIWMDNRSIEYCKEIENKIGHEKIFELSGNSIQPSYTLPKILWYKNNSSELYNKTEKILQSNSYIVFQLTGKFSQDVSQGYGYQCFDIKQHRFDKDVCNDLSIDYSILPEIYLSHDIVGHVTRRAALECGLMEGIPVVAGGLDAACATLGAGVLRDGETQEQGGQAGGMSICLESYKADPRMILSAHVVPDTWLMQGGTVGGGGILNWLEREFGYEERQMAKTKQTNSFIELMSLANSISPGSDGVLFLPYMAGERSPIWNPKAKGVYFGLDYSKTKGHIIRSGLEGTAYALKHNLSVAEEAGVTISELRATGGAANSELWTQIKSDVTGIPITVVNSDSTTALGAALLAGIGVGVYGDFEDAIERTVRTGRKHKPIEKNQLVYNEQYKKYISLLKNLESLMV